MQRRRRGDTGAHIVDRFGYGLDRSSRSRPHVRLTLDAIERHAEPGVTTGELDRVAASVFAAHGARSAPALVYGFPGDVLISVK